MSDKDEALDGQRREKGVQQDVEDGSGQPSSLGPPLLLLLTCFTPSGVKGTQATVLTQLIAKGGTEGTGDGIKYIQHSGTCSLLINSPKAKSGLQMGGCWAGCVFKNI